MDETFLAWQTLNKSTEILNATHDATINLANLNVANHQFNLADGKCECFLIVSVDTHPTCIVIVNIDVGTGGLGDATDILSSWTNECTDLLGIYLYGVNARSILINILTRRRKMLSHPV